MNANPFWRVFREAARRYHAITSRLAPRDFLHCEQGSALVFIGLGVMMLVAVTGSAIDMGRVQIVQSRMQNALDAAGLAAGSTVNTSNIAAEVNKYFYANFPSNYNGTTITNLTVTANADNTELTLHVDGTVPMTFMKALGINNVTVAADAHITRTTKGLELVLVLDGTGSMNEAIGGGSTKISALRAAATDLVNILYGDDSTIDNLWIGIVPFAQAVNISASRGSWTTTASVNWGPTSWMGCVEAREPSGRDITDDPPSVALFPKYYSACMPYFASWGNSWYGNNVSGSNPHYSNCQTSGSNFHYRSPVSITLGPNQFCPTQVTSLTHTKSTILSAINSLQAGAGDTHINLGMVWGWRMLSPRWRTLWGGEMNPNGLPLDYNEALMNKAVILLSDGDNHYVANNYTAYGPLSAGRLGTTSSSTAVGVLNTRTRAVCDALKAKNVLIYTIALGTAISSSGKNLLQDCASKPEFYFESPNAAALETAFHQIGDSLSNLRLSQ